MFRLLVEFKVVVLDLRRGCLSENPKQLPKFSRNLKLEMENTSHEESDNVFDVFDKPSSSKISKKVEILKTLWESSICHSATKTSQKSPQIRSFDFDVNEDNFVNGYLQDVNSLFFEYINTRKKDFNILQDFIVINFVSEENPENWERTISTAMLKESIVEKTLNSGITANNDMVFRVLGCSNSQLKKGSFYFMREKYEGNSIDLINEMIVSVDDLQTKLGVAKRTKYVGLLFSGCDSIVKLPENFEFKITEDIKNENYNFTDGCGIISYKLASWIRENDIKLKEKWKFEIPSIWQIRYCGKGKLCKGTLVLDFEETEKPILTIRPSMAKGKSFNPGVLDYKLGILTTTEKPKIGKLNKQLVTLLSANVDESFLTSIQDSYLKRLENVGKNPIDALEFYCLELKIHKFQKLLEYQNSKSIPQEFIQLNQVAENVTTQRLQIPLACSRLLIGAAYPEKLHNYLRENECIVISELGLIQGEVVVYRSPSYAPGDVRVLKAVKLPGNHPVLKLKNIILFSTVGSRPDPDKMSGGDLDGDIFLVIWDKKIIEASVSLRNVPPSEYEPPEKVENVENLEQAEKNWISYASKWENSMLGQIDSCFFKLATDYGINSKECQELSALFSRAVDQHPSDLKKLKTLISQRSQRQSKEIFADPNLGKPIWDKMLENQVKLRNSERLKQFSTTFKDWTNFHDKIQLSTYEKIPKMFTKPEILSCVAENKIAILTQLWMMKILDASKRGVPQKSQSLIKLRQDVFKSLGTCAFNCTLENCLRKHPGNLDWFNSWKTHSKEVLDRPKEKIDVRIDKLGLEITEQVKFYNDFAAKLMMDKCAQKSFDEEMEIIKNKNQELAGKNNDILGANFVNDEILKVRKSYKNEIEYKKTQIESLKRQKANDRREFHDLTCKLTKLEADLQNKSKKNLDLKNEILVHRQKIEEFKKAFFERLMKFSNEISEYEDCIRGFELKLKKTFDQELYKKLMYEVEIEINRLKPFSFALKSIFNEIDLKQTLVKDQENIVNRAAINLELRMCLSRESNRCYQELSEKRLPTFRKRHQFISALETNDVIIITASTGSGKSTQVPQYIADDLHNIVKNLKSENRSPRVVCTQPRRVAATSIAKRVSQEYSGSFDYSSSKNSSRNRKKSPEKRPMNSKTASIVAYPLYSSCGFEDRALDINDRIGYKNEVINPGDTWTRNRNFWEHENKNEDILQGTAAELGGWVGYRIGSRGQPPEERRNSQKLSYGTRIEFVTEGLLLQVLKHQQDSTYYDCIIIDEAHERNKETDLLMALLRRMVKRDNNTLKVIVMSASINQNQFAEYFGNCPIVECDGKLFDVEEIYQPALENRSRVLSSFDEHNVPPSENSRVHPLIKHAVDILFEQVHPQDEGDVLIFLPGKAEIYTALDLITERAKLTGKWNSIFGVNNDYVRKVICCTNIAETSLTIPGVKFVIDVLQVRKKTYNHQLRVTALELQKTSQASAKQRKGRAGRIEPGTCYRLISDEEFQKLAEFDEPELKHCPIDELYLYAVDVFGSIERLELMPDAQPDKESLLNAEERLLNLEFIEKNEKGEVSLTNDGKLASELLSEVSLEGVRMILSARKFGMLGYAIQLAVVLRNSYDIKINTKKYVKRSTDSGNDHRKFYLDEFGDAFTWFKIFRTFLEIYKNAEKSEVITLKTKWLLTKKGGVENWCHDLGVNFEALKQVQKSIDLVYVTLKRQNKLGNCIIETGLNLDDVRKHLCSALISGFFHNIVELHDKDLIKAGYSLLTPSSINRKYCETPPGIDSPTSENHRHLLKVFLSEESAVFKHGDVVRNTYLIFTDLFKTYPGPVYMQQACRISDEMIMQHSNKRWQDTCDMVKKAEDTSELCLKSFVDKYREEFISPRVLGSLLKSKPSGFYMKELEINSGAVVQFLFEAGQIRLYGSSCEVKGLLTKSSLKSDILSKKAEIKAKDALMFYPAYRNEICKFKTGLKLDFKEVRLLRATFVGGWDENVTVIVRNISPEIRSKLKAAIQDLKKYCSDEETLKSWSSVTVENEYEDKSKSRCCKIRFTAQNVASFVTSNFKKIHSMSTEYSMFVNARAFMSNVREVQVIETKIYPSVQKLVDENYPQVKVKTLKDRFVFSPIGKTDSEIVDKLVEDLKENETFESLSWHIPGVDEINKKNKKWMREFISDFAKRFQKSFSVKLVLCYSKPPTLEVYGDSKDEVLSKIKKIVPDFLAAKLKSEKPSDQTKVLIRLQRKEMVALFYAIEEFEEKFRHVSISITTTPQEDDLTLPEVELIATENSKRDLVRAEKFVWEIVKRKIEAANSPKSILFENRCRKCLRKVLVWKPKNKKDYHTHSADEFSDLSNSIQVNRLALCGCTFCFKCLSIIVDEQISSETFFSDGLKCPGMSLFEENKICGHQILNYDLKDNFSAHEELDNILEKAFLGYVKQWVRVGTIETSIAIERCPKCQFILTRAKSEVGVFKCPSCQHKFCSKCASMVRNQNDYDHHSRKLCTEEKSLLAI